MSLLCDLHTHSTYSDGTFSPAQLICQAERIGLRAVVLCDHNTVDGLPEFLEAARASSVEGIPGVEFSTDYQGRELHIVGMFIEREHFDAVRELLKQALQRKEQSNIDLVNALGRAGIRMDYNKVKESTPGGLVNRAVMAAEMVRLGYCETVQQAFSLWLSEKRGYYIPAAGPDAFEVIRFIRSIGAVAVLAHPFLNLDEERLRVFLAQAKEHGLDGMEVSYPLFSGEQTRLAGEIAREFGLLTSGGSDFHGENKPHIALGDCAVEESCMIKLAQRRGEARPDT